MANKSEINARDPCFCVGALQKRKMRTDHSPRLAVPSDSSRRLTGLRLDPRKFGWAADVADSGVDVTGSPQEKKAGDEVFLGVKAVLGAHPEKMYVI